MKKTGKALSLVLSMALVVSSLTATFASAATSEGSTVTLTQDTVYLANGGTNAATLTANVYSQLSGVKSMVSSSGQTIANATLKDAAITSGGALATLDKDIDNSKVDVVLNSASKTGTVKIAARYVGSYNKEDGTAVNVNGQTTLTVTILQNNSLVIGKYAATPTAGVKPSDLDTLSRSVGDSTEGAVYLVAPGSDALATFVAQEIETSDANLAADQTTWDGVTSFYFVNQSSTALAVTGAKGDKKFTITAGTAAQGSGATAGKTISAQTAAVTATKYSKSASAKATASTLSADTIKTSAKVDNRIEVNQLGSSTYNKITMDVNGRTVLRDTAASTPGADVVLATGTVVDCDSLSGQLTVEKGTVSSITNAANGIEIDKGAVTSITDSSNVTLKDGSVGSITDVAASSSITINGGKVGTITPATNSSTGLPEDISVTVNATVKNTAASAGAVTAKTVVVGNSDAVTTASTITKVISTSDDFSATIDGAYASIATVDVNKKNASINYLDDYNGAAATIANVSADKLPALSVASSANVTFNNDVTLGSVSDDGTITFSGNTSVAGAIGSGSGTIIFVPGKFYTTADLSGVVMEVLGGKISSGMTLFTAAPYAVSSSSFTPKGYTVAKVSGDKVDTFKVDQPDFYGIVLNKTTDKVAKGYSATYTASAYPQGTKLPDGATVQFTFDGSEDNFSFTDNGNGTATVKVLKYDDVFTDLNKATLTAKLYDAYGVELYQYTPATCAITAIATPVVSFTTDGFPTSMKLGQSYQVKITSADGTAPQVAFASNFAKTVSTTVSGNSTFVKFTVMTPNAGSYGVYVSGDKKAVIAVGNACDTKTVTKTNGQNYTFKVTALSAPTFAVATVGTIKPSKVVGNDYFYTVKATANKGAHGVYINGIVAATYTFA